MKKTIGLLTWTVTLYGLAMFSTQPVFGQNTRFYVKGGVGPAFTEETSLREFPLVGPLSGVKVKFDPGFQFRFAGGYQITDWLATELETGVTYNTIKSIAGADESDGSLANVPLLANLVLQCPKSHRFVPYLGGGLGGSTAILHARDLSFGGTQLSGTQSDVVFAYHGFAGVRYNINDRMGVSIAYRYFGTTAPSWDADLEGIGGAGKIRFGDNKTHSVTAAFTFNF